MSYIYYSVPIFTFPKIVEKPIEEEETLEDEEELEFLVTDLSNSAKPELLAEEKDLKGNKLDLIEDESIHIFLASFNQLKKILKTIRDSYVVKDIRNAFSVLTVAEILLSISAFSLFIVILLFLLY